MRWSTQIPETLIDSFTFSLQPPKTVTSNAKTEAINSFQQYADFVTTLMYGANSEGKIPQIELEIFKKLLADDQLPLLNIQKLEELKDKANLEATEAAVKPSATNGDNGDDFGLDDLDLK
jgi:hypothetical protein